MQEALFRPYKNTNKSAIADAKLTPFYVNRGLMSQVREKLPAPRLQSRLVNELLALWVSGKVKIDLDRT